MDFYSVGGSRKTPPYFPQTIKIKQMKNLNFGELDFFTLEKMFGVRLFGLNETETEDILNELEELWNKLTTRDKLTLLK